MYHFTLIDEASLDHEPNSSLMQEKTLENTSNQSRATSNVLMKTAHLLQKYINQPNCVRIYINKN